AVGPPLPRLTPVSARLPVPHHAQPRARPAQDEAYTPPAAAPPCAGTHERAGPPRRGPRPGPDGRRGPPCDPGPARAPARGLHARVPGRTDLRRDRRGHGHLAQDGAEPDDGRAGSAPGGAATAAGRASRRRRRALAMPDRPNRGADRPQSAQHVQLDGPDGGMDDELLFRSATARTTPEEERAVADWRARSAANERRFRDTLEILRLAADAHRELNFGPAPAAEDLFLHQSRGAGASGAGRRSGVFRRLLLVAAAAA